MKLYSFEEILDEDLGKVGSPARDAFEAEVEAEIRAYHEAIRIECSCRPTESNP